MSLSVVCKCRKGPENVTENTASCVSYCAVKLLNPEVDISMIAMESARKCIGSGMIIGKLLLYLSMCTRDNAIKCYQMLQ